MAQTQTPSIRYQSEGQQMDYTPSSAVWGGDVVVVGTVPMIAACDIAANTLGALSMSGVWKVPKDGSSFTQGDAVYWNTTGSPVTGTASTGASTSTASGANLMGFAFATQAAGDSYVYVKLTAAKRTATIAGSVTADDITGSDSSLGIGGQAAATGGAIVITGGTSSTSGTAGGAVSVVGGTPGATGVGGAVSMTGAVGGSTSGTAGAASVTGGAGTAGNATGGAASLTGGAGQGSAAGGASSVIGGAGGLTGAGGAITITSGAGGATSGAAGAINIAVGSATSGNGAALTITAGNGAAGTNSGGMINLVPGTAVSTGTIGEVQVNANSNLIYVTVALTATDASRPVWIATRPVILKTVSFQHTTGSTSGTLQVEKLTGTTAAGSGTVLLTGTIDLSTTTVANTTTNGTLIATVASLKFATGDRAAVKIAGTMTGLVNGIAVLGFAPI